MKPHRLRARNLAPDSENKIHDDEVARKFGFEGALVPGVEVFAYATHPFAEAWGEDFLRRGFIDVQFRRPVYQGDDVDVVVEAADDDSYAVSVVGPDGVVRALGRAGLATAAPAMDRDRVAAGELPSAPPAADATSLAVGTRLGTVHEPVTVTGHEDYRAGVSDALGIYEHAVQPGVLLRAVNAVLHRSVRLGPWIHTASSCHFLEPAPVPTTLVASGVVTDRYDKNGRSWVRYDALVLADDRPVMWVDHLAIYDLEAR